MTMPASRDSRSRGVLAESHAIDAAQVMPAAQPCTPRARSSTTAFGANAKASVETVSSAEPASAMRRPPMRGVEEAREQPDDRRRQRVGGEHDARTRLREVEAVGVARQERHDGLVERRLHEHRQADRDRDAARVHGSILPARARRAAAGRRRRSRARGGEAKLYDVKARSFDHSPTRRCAGSSRTTTLRLGAQAPSQPLPARGATGTPHPAICLRAPLRHYCTGPHGARRPAQGDRHARGSTGPCGGTRPSALRSPPSCCAAAAARRRRCAPRPSASWRRARREADAVRKEAEVAAKEHMLAARSEVEEQLKGRSLEVARAEERLGARAAQLDQMAADVAAREGRTSERDARARREREGRISQLAEQGERELERVAAMTQAQAREALLARVEEQARHDVARRIRTIEDEARHDSDRRVRNIISIGIQRTASAHAASTTVSSVQLPSDEMKGRIIGREGRNIRALENLTGVDVIIDDTPGAVLLSGFDGMRREIARLTLTRLIADGRIHPGAHRGVLRPGQDRGRGGDRARRRAGQLRRQGAGPAPRAAEGARAPALPHELRPERAQPLRRGRARRGDHGRRARRVAEDRAARGAAARRRQGAHARGRGLARDHRRAARAQAPRVGGRRARHRGAPLRGRAADDRGGARAGRRRDLGRPPRRARRVDGALREAARGPRADRDLEARRRALLRDAGRAATCA